jgi:hypothetical protein
VSAIPVFLDLLAITFWVLISHVPVQGINIASMALYLPLRDFVDFILGGVIIPARDGE